MSRTIVSSYRSVSGGVSSGDFRNVTLIMSGVQLSYLLADRNSWSHEESCTIKKILVDPGRRPFPFPDALVSTDFISCRTCFDVLREDAN